MNSNCFAYEVSHMNLTQNNLLINHIYTESGCVDYRKTIHPLTKICRAMCRCYNIEMEAIIDLPSSFAIVKLSYNKDELDHITQIQNRFKSITKSLLMADIKQID